MLANMKEMHQISLLQRRVLSGDEQAFRQLYLLLAGALKQFAYTIIHSKEQAEEITEDVFIHVWQNKAGLMEIKNLKVYLYVATRNTSLNYLHKKSGRTHYDTIDYAHAEFAATDPDPEQLFITSEMRRRIDEVIQALPTKCKLIFKMAKEDRLKYREIADILNITVKTIDNQLAIALNKIGEAINFRKFKSNEKKHN